MHLALGRDASAGSELRARCEERGYWPSCPSRPSSGSGFLECVKDVNQGTRRCPQQLAAQTGGFGAETKTTTHIWHRLTGRRAAVLGDIFADPHRQAPGCPQGRSQSREVPRPPTGVRGSGPAEASGLRVSGLELRQTACPPRPTASSNTHAPCGSPASSLVLSLPLAGSVPHVPLRHQLQALSSSRTEMLSYP